MALYTAATHAVITDRRVIPSAPMRRDDLLDLPRPALMKLLRGGHPIAPGALDDWEYRGVSLGLPRFVERLTWKTFQKTFHRDPATGALRGWNVRIEQRGLDAESVALTRGGAPFTFGHYRVVPGADVRSPEGCDRGLMIHYGLGGNAPLDPMGRVRDPIVALNEGSADLLLGWSYVDVAGLLVHTPTFFVLERERRLGHVAAPPRS